MMSRFGFGVSSRFWIAPVAAIAKAPLLAACPQTLPLATLYMGLTARKPLKFISSSLSGSPENRSTTVKKGLIVPTGGLPAVLTMNANSNGSLVPS